MALEGVLLFGAAGQLGHELASRLPALGPVTALSRQDIDLSNVDALRSLLQTRKPAWIVNASGYTAVDKAEQEPVLAQAINTTAPAVMAEEAARSGACLVHYSTDYVFNGQASRPYLETDPSDPQSVYGLTKRDGEQAVMCSGARYLLFRSSWVVGAHGQNFLKTMLRLAQERDSLRVVADQLGVPTAAAWMADITLLAMQHGLQGLFHLTPAGQTNWHAYAQYVLGQAQALGWTLKAGPEQVQAITTADYPLPAVRPAYSMLDSHALAQALNVELPSWQAGVDAVLAQLRPTSGQVSG
jgi:dTDP-4-dehydrorhamnose reductase